MAVALVTLVSSADADTKSKYSVAAQWSASPANAGLSMVIGTVTKHPLNPLFVQDTPWEPRLDNGYPNVAFNPSAGAESPWQCWYGDCVKGCGSQILLYANSTDGLTWKKPDLGIFDAGTVRPDLAESVGKHNNILLVGGGIGVYVDEYEHDASRRYKAFGGFSAGGGFAESADGLQWSAPTPVRWPSPQRYDTHTNVFWDATTGRYVVTTRDGFSNDPGRTIGIAEGAASGAFAWSTDAAPPVVENGTKAHQLYSQITFPFHDAYLGIVSVFDSTNPSSFGSGKVHCRLSITSNVTEGWRWVDVGGLTGRDFIPLGSHDESGSNAFDSHICFAAASPVRMPDGSARIYYMGGNGPHNGDRNSSFALATLPHFDRFAGVGGTGKTNLTVKVTGKTLIVTAECAEGGSIRVGVPGDAGGRDPSSAVPITAAEATDVAVLFATGADFATLAGTFVTLEVRLEAAVVYTVGFV